MTRTMIATALLLTGCFELPWQTERSQGTETDRDDYAPTDTSDTWLDAPEPFSDCSREQGHDYTIDLGAGTVIEDDKLLVAVSYGGGCEEHQFQICWPEDTFDDSTLPVQTRLDIWHGGARDYCEALVTEVVEFDLVLLREAYERTFDEEHGTILLRLDEQLVEYDF